MTIGGPCMKKQVYIGLGILGSILAFIFIFFLYNSYKTNFNDAMLSELTNEFIYIKRDEDLVLKLYRSDSTLKEEELLYEHESDINQNIISAAYINDQLLFEAYNDEANTFQTYELDLETLDATLYDKSYSFDGVSNSLDGTLNNEDFKVISDKGSLYLSFPDKKVLLEKFYGLYDEKFSPGNTPLSLSADGKYLFYERSRHLTAFGMFLQGIFLNDDTTQTFIMNLETLEKSEFTEFYGQLLELKK